MTTLHTLSLAFDPGRILSASGLAPDPWQAELLRSAARQVLLCCSRQAGKSTVVAALALHTALFRPGSLVLLLSPSLRQSSELFRKLLGLERSIGRPLTAVRRSQLRLDYVNGSRVVCLPGREDTLRGYSGAALLVIDEAARVPDRLYHAVRPMLAVSQGRLAALSTPFGQRGWFWREWTGDGPFHRIRVTWRGCPRISEAFLAEERRALGEAWVAQEYETEFNALEGLVFPGFSAAVTDDPPPGVSQRTVGGIDFGFRNPFAAVWGFLTRDDVLWITHERYLRQATIADHLPALRSAGPVTWYADPSSPESIEELRSAGLRVFPGRSSVRAGIEAVTSRIQSGRLRVRRGGCPELIREAGLYRYPSLEERSRLGEAPIDTENHALSALRYLVLSLDRRHVALPRRPSEPPADPSPPPPRPDDDHLWALL